MAKLIEIRSFHDNRGSLSVIENEIPFEIKRVFYIYNTNEEVRGGHKHHKTIQAVICINGSCTIANDNGTVKNKYILNNPNLCLLLEPQDWHEMYNFSQGAILLVLASEFFDIADYIYDRY